MNLLQKKKKYKLKGTHDLSLGHYFVIPAKEVSEESDKCLKKSVVSELNLSPLLVSSSVRNWGYFIRRGDSFTPRSEISCLFSMVLLYMDCALVYSSVLVA